MKINICETCKKEFSDKHKPNRTRRFCSVSCRVTYTNLNRVYKHKPPHTFNCELCGELTKETNWTRSVKRRFCKGCARRAVSIGLVKGPPGKLKPQPRPCDSCGKMFTPAYPSKTRQTRQGRFCSNKCFGTYYKTLWADPEYAAKMQTLYRYSPNKTELLFDSLTPPELRFVGDGKFWIRLPNGKWKNPDFKVTGKNKVIELFGGMGWFHTEQEAVELTELYKQAGYDCLVLIAPIVTRLGKRETMLKQVLDFINS